MVVASKPNKINRFTGHQDLQQHTHTYLYVSRHNSSFETNKQQTQHNTTRAKSAYAFSQFCRYVRRRHVVAVHNRGATVLLRARSSQRPQRIQRRVTQCTLTHPLLDLFVRC